MPKEYLEIKPPLERKREIKNERIKFPNQVTITLFSVQNVKEGVSSFNEQLFGQIANIRSMVLKLTAEALKNRTLPPFIRLSLLLIPDWNVPDNGYENPNYQKTKDLFFVKIKDVFFDLAMNFLSEGFVFEIEDFYEKGLLTENEKTFMHHLRANGSNADIIKTRALINNPDCKHLQIDSNTIIKDFESFYQNTFGLPEDRQHDGLNANQYAPAHVSANNKVVYTCPNSQFLEALKHTYLDYMRKNKNNPEDKKRESNAIYEKVFTPALQQARLVYYNTDIGKHKVFYPPHLSREEYNITSDVVTAINMSWAANTPLPLQNQILKQIAPFQYKDAGYDYASFAYIIKKYCGWVPFCAREYEDPGQYYENFLKMSDVEADLKVLKDFYLAALSNDSQKLKDAIRKTFPKEAEKYLSDLNFISSLRIALATSFPNTPKANVITQALFNRTVEELAANPSNVELNKTFNTNEVISALVEIDKNTIQEIVKRPTKVFTAQMLQRTANFANERNLEITPRHLSLLKSLFNTVEAGENIENALQETSHLPAQIKEFIISEITWALEQGNDDINHFNYLPNREQLLEQVKNHQEKPSRRQKPFMLSQKTPETKETIQSKAVPQHQDRPPKVR